MSDARVGISIASMIRGANGSTVSPFPYSICPCRRGTKWQQGASNNARADASVRLCCSQAIAGTSECKRHYYSASSGLDGLRRAAFAFERRRSPPFRHCSTARRTSCSHGAASTCVQILGRSAAVAERTCREAKRRQRCLFITIADRGSLLKRNWPLAMPAKARCDADVNCGRTAVETLPQMQGLEPGPKGQTPDIQPTQLQPAC